MNKKLLFFIFLFCSFFYCTAHAVTYIPEQKNNVNLGSKATKLTQVGDDLYISGTFTTAEISNSKLNIFNPSTQEKTYFPIVNNEVENITSDQKGGMYIAGYFTKLGSYEISKVAHLWKNGSIDTVFNPPIINGRIYSTLYDKTRDTLYITGSFTSINEIVDNRIYIAALDGTTGELKSWYPGSLSGQITSWTQDDDYIYYFLGQIDPQIYKVHKDTGEYDSNWTDDFNGASCYARFLKEDTTSLYLSVDSECTAFGSSTITSPYFFSLNKDTKAITNYDHLNLDGKVYNIQNKNNTYYFSGEFTSILGENRTRFAKLTKNNDTFTLEDLDISFDDTINKFQLLNNKLYFIGDFTQVLSATREHFAVYDLNSSTLTNWSITYSPSDSIPNDFLVTNNFLAIGGEFNSINPLADPYFIKFDLTDKTLSQAGPSEYAEYFKDGNYDFYNNKIYFLVPQGSSFPDSYKYYLASYNLSTEQTTIHDTISIYEYRSAYYNPEITLFKVIDNILYIGGTLTSSGGTIKQPLGALNLDNLDDGDLLATKIAPNIDFTSTEGYFYGPYEDTEGEVEYIYFLSNEYAGFSSDTRTTLVDRFAITKDASSRPSTLTHDDTFPIIAGSEARDIAFTDDKIIVVGNFSACGDTTIEDIVVINKSDLSVDTNFIHDLYGAYSPKFQKVLINNNEILAGGYFTKINDNSYENLLSLDLTDGSINTKPITDITNANAVPYYPLIHDMLLTDDNHLFLAGFFLSINEYPTGGIAEFNLNEEVSIDEPILSATKDNSVSAKIKLSNTNPSTSKTVSYSITGTATEGVDYTEPTGTVSFQEGDSSKFIEISLANNSSFEPNKEMIVTLTETTSDALGGTTSTTVTLVDIDPAVLAVPENTTVPIDTESSVTVTATNTDSSEIDTYTETVSLETSTTSISQTFTEQDNSSKTFNVTFNSIGNHTVTLEDTKGNTSTQTVKVVPPTITDLLCEPINTSSVTITFSSYADLDNYVAKYHTEEITEDNWDSATTFNQSWDIEATKEVSIDGLTPGRTYYFALKQIKEDGGEEFTSSLSNIINCTTLNNRKSSQFIPSKPPKIEILNLQNQNQIKEGFVIRGKATTYSSRPDKVSITLNGENKYPDSLMCTNQTCNWSYTLPTLQNNNNISFTVYDNNGMTDTVSLSLEISQEQNQKPKEEIEEKENKEEKEEEKDQEDNNINEQVYTSLLNQIISLLQQILSWYK